MRWHYPARPVCRCRHAESDRRGFHPSRCRGYRASLYRELVACTQRESLCLGYELFVDQKDPGHFVFIEQWPNRDALDIHCASEHFQRLVPQINAFQRAPCRVLLMDAARV